MNPRPLPLDPEEAATWRALARVMPYLSRALDDDLMAREDMTMTRYLVLMLLSEARGGSLRMKDLAHAATLSPSRMTRVVQGLVEDGYVVRSQVVGDARATVATLTPAGLERLEQAWPSHVAGVRAYVLDRIAPDDLPVLRRILDGILGDTPEGPPQIEVS